MPERLRQGLLKKHKWNAPMNKNAISCQLNDRSEATGADLFDFVSKETLRHVYDFHRSLPGYSPTPLVRLPGLAGYLGVRELFVKDENHRFDLKAFKILGASYAMAKCLGDVVGLGDEDLTFHNIVARKAAYENRPRTATMDARLPGLRNGSAATRWCICQKGLHCSESKPSENMGPGRPSRR
jgi:hypothetical protein